jgi:hypothetical protein
MASVPSDQSLAPNLSRDTVKTVQQELKAEGLLKNWPLQEEESRRVLSSAQVSQIILERNF